MTAAETVARVIAALSGLSIPYMTVGSFSTNVYGRPRSTKDADFVIQLGNISIQQLAARIGADFTLDPQMSFETITATSRYILRHRDTAFAVEFFLLSEDAHDQQRFSRRLNGDVAGSKAFVPTAEDVVITKLRWSKHGKRQKDVDDVSDVLGVQAGRLDLEYIRGWCDRHGTRELFERLLDESRRFDTPGA